jgi:mono/diheme cytochrome c family protein
MGATAVAVFAAIFFAVWVNLANGERDRADVILGLDPDLGNGRAVYNEQSRPACATCHSLVDAGAISDRASDLDVLQPSARVTVESIVSGTVRAHDAQDYAEELTDQQIADVAYYVEEAAGR